jgi:hypothetical protein
MIGQASGHTKAARLRRLLLLDGTNAHAFCLIARGQRLVYLFLYS